MKNIKVGTIIEQVKEIEGFGHRDFNYIGSRFKVISVSEGEISFKCDFGTGIISKEGFQEYFKVVEVVNGKPILQAGQKVKITGGMFVSLNLTGIIKEIKEKIVVEVDGNLLIVDVNDIETIKEKPTIIVYKDAFFGMDGREYSDCSVRIKGRRTTVLIPDERNDKTYKSSVYCCQEDVYNQEDGVYLAFTKALIKKLTFEIEEMQKFIKK